MLTTPPSRAAFVLREGPPPAYFFEVNNAAPGGGWQAESRGISAPFMGNNGDGITLIIKAALTVQPLAVHRVMAVDAQELQIIPPVDCAIIRHVLRGEMSFVMDDEMRRLSCSGKGPVMAALTDVVL